MARRGVGVGAAGDIWVQVYEGAALTEWKDDAGEPQRVQAGEAVGVEAASAARPQARTFAPEMFVRALPQRRSNDPPGGALFNRSRFDTVHVVPAPGQIAIDGELADWDASGAFRSACVEPYGADYFVEGMMMYDAEKLYIAAHVGDPHPMRSRRDAAADPTWVWAGGSVIVRLSTSRALAWPINAAAKALGSKAFPDAGLRPQDRSDRIAHLIMWYHQPTGTARLQRAFGMDSHGRSDDSVGWQGTFRRDPNGRGYVLEYAIPWALLHAGDDPPRAGDVLAASWNVHWSDEDGRTSRGHLVEVTYPPAGPYLFINSATWGRALYHAKGKLPPGTVQPHQPDLLPR